jgi:hypothetical protein
MPVHIEESLFFDMSADAGPRTTLPPSWLQRRLDPRPKCTLVLGDGFTRDFLQSQGLIDVVKSSVPAHFKSWPELRYYVTKGDARFTDGDANFWESAKWPRLFAEWARINPGDVSDFYTELAKNGINPDRAARRWSVDSKSVAYELRCYLWHLFRSWDRVIQQRLTAAGHLAPWHWMNVLRLLLAEYRLTVVSFNYDRVFEAAYMASASGGWTCCGILHKLCFESHAFAETAPANTVHLIKVHGGIDINFLTGQEKIVGPRATPWLDDPFTLERNVVFGNRPIYNPALDVMPLIPELVPPGHQGDHLCSPEWAATDLAKAYLAEGDLTIFCGLSAAEPDTQEVKDLVSMISPASFIIQVGREDLGDRGNRLAGILAAHNQTVQFVDAKQLNGVFDHLSKAGLVRNDWGSTFTS